MTDHDATPASPRAPRGSARCLAGLLSASVALALVSTPRSAGAGGLDAFSKGPYLQELGATGVTVRFELAAPSAATVEVRADGDAGAPTIAASRAPGAYHSLRIDGLKPGQAYRYVARASGASQSGAFTTAPEDAAAPFSFLVYGDNRTDEVAHATVVRALVRAPGSFLVNTGDYVADGSNPSDWQSFFTIEKGLLRDRALFGCIGNHELLEPSGAAYLRYFGPSDALPAQEPAPKPSAAPLTLVPLGEGGTARAPLAIPGAAAPTARARLFWSFRWGSARFFMLNAFDTWVSGEEREWLASEMARSKSEPGVTGRIAVLHHGPWSAGPHGTNNRFVAAGVPDMLAQAGVDLVLSGHDHIYERGFANGLRYVVSGGGGAPLYRIAAPLPTTRKAEPTYHFIEAKVTTDAIKLVVKRADGSLIEECGFTKGTPWDCDKTTPAATAASESARAPNAAPEVPRAEPSKCGCRVVGEAANGAPSLATALAISLVAIGARARRGRREY